MFALLTKNEDGSSPPMKQQIKQMQSFYKETYHKDFLEGPYKTSYKAMLVISGFALLGLREMVKDEKKNWKLETNELKIRTLKIYKLSGFLYGAGLLGVAVAKGRQVSFATYTVMSWSLSTLRYLIGWLALVLKSEKLKDAEEFLRFPVLAQNVVTCAVWYGILFPAIAIMLKIKEKKGKSIVSAADFVSFSLSPFLLHVHGVNLPFALFGHCLEPRELLLKDFYNSVCVAGAYLSFYLYFLDGNGLPIYFILSPRTKVGALSFVGILGGYFGIFKAVNSKLTNFQEYSNFLLNQI